MKTNVRWFAMLAALIATTPAQAGPPTVEVIATGLDNPRGLGFAPNGNLYVAEAGSGGSGNCRPSPDGQPAEVCYGETGFSGASAFGVMGWGGDFALRAGLGPKSGLFGTLLFTTPNGLVLKVSDIASNELRHNPAGGPVDSDPYGMLALPGKRIVADAGANVLVESGAMDLLQPDRDRTFVVLPPTAFGTEAVPTTVVEGPAGDLYVGLLTGAPSHFGIFPGDGQVLRLSWN